MKILFKMMVPVSLRSSKLMCCLGLCLILGRPAVFSQDLSSLYDTVNAGVVVLLTEEKKLSKAKSYPQAFIKEGLGSGFLISENQVLTAAHVVNVAEKVMVKFDDGEQIPAKVTSAFDNPDIALLTLLYPKKNAKTLPLGNSDAVKVGERIFIVGVPFGLEHSLSSGYISGRLKDNRASNPFSKSEYLQTDAAINSGNSGGPMFNLKGEVVGIVSHIKTVTGGFQGIGFAASINIAKELLLEKNIPWTGASLFPISVKAAKVLNVPAKSGLLVQQVVAGSPYSRLGVRGGTVKAIIEGQEIILGGDIILSINGIPFEMTDETLKRIGDFANEKSKDLPIILEILREGKIIVLRNDK